MIPKGSRIYGLIGYPVTHSLSPLMHNAAFRALEGHYPEYKNAQYFLFEVEPQKLKDFLRGTISVKDTEGHTFSSGEIRGFNITIPHKVKALEFGRLFADVTTRSNVSVELCGAINTAKRENDRLCYYNTDREGFVRSLLNDLAFHSQDKNVLLVGCGGAGRAVVAGLTQKGMGTGKIFIFDTSVEAMESAKKHFARFDFLKDTLEFISAMQLSEKIRISDLLVNASPVGMKEGDSSILDKGLLHRGLSVYDIVYNRETQLLRDARSLGLPAVGGLGMFLYQGMASFEIWTGQQAPQEVMRQALSHGLKRR